MSLFKPGLEKKLAESFVGKPSDLVGFHAVLKSLAEKGLLTVDAQQMSSYVSTALQHLCSSPYVAFHIYDSWAEDNGEPDGIALYQLVNSAFASVLGLKNHGAPQSDEVLRYLKKIKVDSVVTTSLGDTEVGGLARISRSGEDIIEHKRIYPESDYYHELTRGGVKVEYIPLELLILKS
ncbi:MAG TPA: hypothetical protein VK158_04575 [Acidobacteriota bacterium]|nr:hypothetical protein [Acidobacteriota bacterium]